MTSFVHPSSEVHPSARIGKNTKIWHFCHVMEGARIGESCVLGQNVFVGRNVHVGDGVKIQNNVSLYEGVELEDGVFCGPSAVFTNVFNPRGMVSRHGEFQKTRVKKGATIGANATIVCGCTIGRFGFVGAGAVVTRDVPDYALVFGIPARVKGWACECGEKLLLKKGKARCGRCKKEYLKNKNGIKLLK